MNEVAKTLENKLRPDHLTMDDEPEGHTVEDLKKDVEESRADPKPDPNKDAKSKKQYTFDLEFTDGRGKIWAGKFTNKILSIQDRQNVGIMRARMAGNVPFDALDDMTAEINLIVAHCAYSLTESPLWAKDMLTLEDPALLRAIYAEVLAHEATFLGF